ncbi:Alpha/Beta hydrolase protein [Schizophyllum amplum]|uniref:Carboxylic ester hydrolase n=1 Tax=Schizophyllum amplum TaxID=97359 RepID=A0A550CHH9_9AGAR|nr:Alpha/Beta hydrolase protein [Auriculariopsis ampla]
MRLPHRGSEAASPSRWLYIVFKRGPFSSSALLFIAFCLFLLYALFKVFVLLEPQSSDSMGSCGVDLGYVRYEGVCTDEMARFLGIRYAAAPTGNLRWRAPRPPLPEPGILKADTQPKMCAQGSRGMNPSPLDFSVGRQHAPRAPTVDWSEDCLFLNVYAPGGLYPGTRLPVLVWIHGGGYMNGNVAAYDGADLLRQGEGALVIVEIQYRLGVFGFLAGNELQNDGTANAGLLDQDFALKWIRGHIAKFGGDPTDVTLWGESAGAGSVMQQLIANGGRTSPPLFKRAIASSTFLPPQYAFDDPIPEEIYAELLRRTGCAAAGHRLHCLRGADARLLAGTNLEMAAEAYYGTFLFVPVVDGEFIRERPSQALARRRLNANHLLALGVTFEGVNFVDPTRPEHDTATYLEYVFPKLSAAQVLEGVEAYHGVGDDLQRAVAIVGESIFICPGYTLLRAFDAPYKGLFAIPPGRHGQDVPYYFPSRDPAPAQRFDNPAFQRAFAGAIFDFARSGALDEKPTSGMTEGIRPKWPVWSSSSPAEMLFNRTRDEPVVRLIHTDADLFERCRFWESVSEAVGQ